MHSTTVPVKIAQRFAMPVNGDTIFLTNSFEQVTRNPYLIACLLGAFCKNLKFPLTGGHFSIYAFHIKTSVETSIKMFFNNRATISIFCSDRAVVGTLGPWKTTFRKANGPVSIGIP